MFDVLEGFQDAIWMMYHGVNLNFRDQGDVVNSRGMFDQMRSLGYNTSSSVFNLGTMFFLIVIYVVRVIFYGLVVNIVKKPSERTQDYLKSY